MPKVTFSGAATAAGWLVAIGIAWGSLTSTTSTSATEHGRRITELEREVRETRAVNKQTATDLATIKAYLAILLKANGINPSFSDTGLLVDRPWNG